MSQPRIEGSCDQAFARVRELFEEHFVRHPAGGPAELGASVSVVVAGATVVDLWGGYADAARARPWTRDTVSMAASCTKGLTALVAAQQVARGALDPDALVSRYWPEYGCAGKEGTRVWDLFTHAAGQPTLGVKLEPPGSLWDWDRAVSAFAAAAPQWVPGSAHGYHAFSFGHLCGEVVRRVSAGRTVAELLRSEVAAPLGVDVLLAVRPDELSRCAELVAPPAESPFAQIGHAGDETDFATLTRYDDMRLLSAAAANSLQWRQAGWPAAGAFTNARALARIYGALALGGTLDGHELIGRDALHALTTTHRRGADRILNSESAFAFGWQTPAAAILEHVGARSFGHPGGWGSLGWADPDLQLGFGYTLNQTWMLMGDPRSVRLYEAAAQCAKSVG
jgi:CubicO group peptidase (beta-lactamase class C family)